MELNTPVGQLPGVGEAREKALKRLGLETAGDLLRYFPRDHEDRSRFYTIAQAPLGQTVCIRAMVAEPPYLARLRQGLDVVKTSAVDRQDGMSLSFFNQPYVKKALVCGQSYIFCGKLERLGRGWQMTNPYFEREDRPRYTGRIMPVYPLTRGIQNHFLAGLVGRALAGCLDQVEETIPAPLRRKYGLAALPFSYQNIHFPNSLHSLELARQRLIFEELFSLSCALELLRHGREGDPG
ncbi:MAG: ATP-dependent DNA helicase RecG, partial [Oscillospiraceae bacterium]|nr:ATP-dependent DNA helicase RecG [Oscillospiraceae bacterium]